VSSHLERRSDAPATVPIDPRLIEPLRDLGPDDFRQLIEMFLDEAAGRVARLQVLQQHGNAPDMASVSHALRGTSAAFGATGLAALCSEIEAIASAPGSIDLAMLVEAVAIEFDRVRTALTEELS
jgi:HPt (histidine-containing phosphotransfer) domain-containing protein